MIPALTLDTSSIKTGLDLRDDGQPVSLEHALQHGFAVSPQDANIVLTLLVRWLQTRDEGQM